MRFVQIPRNMPVAQYTYMRRPPSSLLSLACNKQTCIRNTGDQGIIAIEAKKRRSWLWHIQDDEEEEVKIRAFPTVKTSQHSVVNPSHCYISLALASIATVTPRIMM